MQQKILIGLCAVGGLILAWMVLTPGTGGTTSNSALRSDAQSVRIENGIQIIHLFARGGYTPGNIIAKAGMPTQLEIETKGTYDCSSAFVIPSMGIQKRLPPTGMTMIDLPPGEPGTSLLGTCSMGMYSMQIQFN